MTTFSPARWFPPVTAFLALMLSAPAVDLDLDGLSDVWEQSYGAQDLLPGDDTDGDAYTNLEESAAGTDPFDGSDFPRFEISALDPDNPPLDFTFPTKLGKLYQFGESQDLQTFNPFGPLMMGDGASQTLSLDTQSYLLSGNVTQQFWANTSGNDLTSLT